MTCHRCAGTGRARDLWAMDSRTYSCPRCWRGAAIRARAAALAAAAGIALATLLSQIHDWLW